MGALLETIEIKVFSDGADLDSFRSLVANPLIKGFTTNPTLMKKAGISDYEAFAKEAINIVGDKPISFEVFTDDLGEMEIQARKIASWGDNVSVKIPVMNTKGDNAYGLIRDLASDGISLNVTAIFTLEQCKSVIDSLGNEAHSIISIFAGRIADSGVDPSKIVRDAVGYAREQENIEVLWASTREPLNIVNAADAGCHIITVPPEMIAKAAAFFGKDLMEFSRETVEMFYTDALQSGFSIA